MNGDQFNDWVDFIISEYNGEHLDSTSPTHLGKITSRIRDTLRHVKNVLFRKTYTFPKSCDGVSSVDFPGKYSIIDSFKVGNRLVNPMKEETFWVCY